VKAIVKDSEASAPYNTYDSILEKPDGSNPNQNAWLTLQLRIKLNFVDSKNPLAARTIFQGGQWFARDYDGYLFPMLDWPLHLKARFQSELIERAEKTWNYQFLLITPKTYSELDYQSFVGSGATVRPNVLCLFRLALAGINDNTPAGGPLRSGTPHRTINIFNLALGTKQVSLHSSVTPTPQKPALKNVTSVEGLSWRSDAGNYDDSDLFKPAWWQKEHNVLSNTVGHEMGHALGQCHIMGLYGDPQYQNGGAKAATPAAYGTGSGNPLDAWNIMGSGDRLYLINAVSWRERIALHSGLPASAWDVNGMVLTPPRKMPLAFTPEMTPAGW
jgi:hypothetical protein